MWSILRLMEEPAEGVDHVPAGHRIRTAFDQLALTI